MDHNATTPLHPQVKEAMIEAMGNFGNPSSLHNFGREAKQRVEEAREVVASFIGASSDEVIFVGSGSEANNTVLSICACPSVGCSLHQQARTGITTSSIEHPCILETSKCLEDRGVNISFVGVDQYGKINLEELDKSITDKTGLVSIMMANNEIGTIQNIKEIASITHERGALVHTDAVQAVGKIPVNVKELDVDFLTLSGHKIYGPKGIGALYVKKGVPFCPLIRGGHQEKGRRAGTENTLGIVGLCKAIEMREKEMQGEYKRLSELKETLKEGIKDKISDVYFNGHPKDCIANTLNVSFAGAEGESILLYLDLEGIAVSTGSACASGSLDPSHVLLATKVTTELAHGSIRISLGRDNSKEDVGYLLDKLPSVIKKIRSMSTVYRKKKKNEK